MRFQTLDEWLRWQETLHPSEIELGLERVSAVASRLGLDKSGFKVISVAGTNGKGSSVALLATILQAAGYQVGTYTSPHLWRYNERIRIQGQMADDDSLCQAFAAIDAARGDISLTYFEFGTLAAIYCFVQAKVDVAVLEVGLGGRLDAVNILDADVALITAIDLDHAQWLGNDRETIGGEKAGIMRPGRPAVCSDPQPPAAIAASAAEVGAELYQLGKDFHWLAQADGWDWQGLQEIQENLPWPALAGLHQLNNAAGVLMVLALLREAMPVSRQALEEGLSEVKVPGRFQVGEGEPQCIFDVAHNPQSARALAGNLVLQPCLGKTLAVVAMLDDKDINGVVAAMDDCVDGWYVAGLNVPRGARAQRLVEAIASQGGQKPVQALDTVTEALAMALSEAQPEDRIVIFGSFYTVAAALSEAV